MAKRSSSVTPTISLSGSNTSGMRSATSATFGRGWPGSVSASTRTRPALVEFGRFADLNRRQRGVGKPETFDFLGLTHYCTTTLRGRFRLGRKPVAKRVNRTLARIDEVLRKRWHHDIWEVGRWLGRVCEGWLNYFAVPGSGRFIRAFLRRLQRRWMRALRRRSQRARFSWKRLERMTEILWPRASIRHPWPDQRFAVKHPR